MDSNLAKKENTRKENTKKENIHEGHRTRVRAKFMKSGLKEFEDYQILEMLLFYVFAQKDTNEIGHKLIKEFGSLENVFMATHDELCQVDGIGEKAAILISLIAQIHHRLSFKSIKNGTQLPNTEAVGKFCIDYFRNLPHERLILISLNCDRKVRGIDIISDGDHSATAVDIRKIVNIALKRKATMVILAHNHPDDSPNPSDADIVMTSRIISVLEGMDIMVADHVICNDYSFVSMDERGFLSAYNHY